MGSLNFFVVQSSIYDTISNLEYFVFYIIRYILLLFGFEMILILLYHYFGKKVSYMAFIFFLIDFVLTGNMPFSPFTTFQMNPCFYLYATTYTSFILEVQYSCIYVGILYALIFFWGFRKRFMRGKFHLKYFLRNDYSYLYHKRKWICLLVLLVPLLFSFLPILSKMDYANIVQYAFGLHHRLFDFDVILTLAYWFQVVSSIFLITDVFVKDLRYQLDHIFLRIDSTLWFFKKIILYIIGFVLLRMFIYFILFLSAFLFQCDMSTFSDAVAIFMIDNLYFLFLQICFLTIYIFFMLFSKVRIFIILFGGVVLFAFVRSIVSLAPYFIVILGGMVTVLVLDVLLFKYFNRKIIQKLGEI